MQSATSYSMSEIEVDPSQEIDFYTKIRILQDWEQKTNISYLANKFGYDPVCIRSIIKEARLLLHQWKQLEPLDSHSGYSSPSFIAIELVLAEWLRRARHNRIHVTNYMFQQSTEFITGHIGHYHLKYHMWSIYLENKYQLTRILNQSAEETTAGHLSMNFGDIINDVRKYFGENIIYPNGPRLGASNDYASGTGEPTTSTYDNSLYVTLELILSEWVKRTLYNGDGDGITQYWLMYIAKYAARCIEFDLIDDPVWIDSFVNKYKLNRIMDQPETKYKSFDSLKEDLTVTINEIIEDFRQQFGSDMIRPMEAVVHQTPSTSRKRSRKSSLSTTVNNSDSTLREVSSWIMTTPSYIALELILREWLKRARDNQVCISAQKVYSCIGSVILIIKSRIANSSFHKLRNWLSDFMKKYNVRFGKASLYNDKYRRSTLPADIIKDLCDQYGENIIFARPDIGDQNIDPCYAAEISRMRTTFFLIVEEWVKRCHHNGFIITDYNLTELTKSIVAYLKCSNDRTISNWTREAEIKFLTWNVPKTICPCDVELQPTNVYLIVKYLREVHGEEKFPPFPRMNVEDVETIERRMARKSVVLQDVDSSSSPLWPNSPTSSILSHLIKKENDCDNDVPEIDETSDDIATESLVEVYITEVHSNDVQMDTVETEPELDDVDSTSQKVREISNVPGTAGSSYRNDSFFDCQELPNSLDARRAAVFEASLPQQQEISNYHDALEYLRPLEQFLLTHEDMRAVGLVNQLENMLKDRTKD